MAELWKPKPITIYRNWLDTIIFEAEENLNDWERNFLASIEERLDINRPLTELQEKTLERLYVKLTK